MYVNWYNLEKKLQYSSHRNLKLESHENYAKNEASYTKYV